MNEQMDKTDKMARNSKTNRLDRWICLILSADGQLYWGRWMNEQSQCNKQVFKSYRGTQKYA